MDAEFEYDLRIMKEKFMKVMQKHNLRMKPKVYLLGKYVPILKHRTGVLLGPTSAQFACTVRHFRKRVQSELLNCHRHHGFNAPVERLDISIISFTVRFNRVYL